MNFNIKDRFTRKTWVSKQGTIIKLASKKMHSRPRGNVQPTTACYVSRVKTKYTFDLFK